MQGSPGDTQRLLHTASVSIGDSPRDGLIEVGETALTFDYLEHRLLIRGYGFISRYPAPTDR